MSNLILAVSLIFPFVAYMVLGFFLRKTKLVSQTTFTELNRVVFKLLMPLVLFLSLYNGDLDSLNRETFLFIFVIALIIIALIFAAAFMLHFFHLPNPSKASLIQGSYRSNILLFGLALTESYYGSEKLYYCSALAVVIVIIYNIASVLLFETYCGNKKSKKDFILSILKNPYIVSSLIGIVFLITGIKLPVILISTMTTLSKITVPLAFIILGGTIIAKDLAKNRVKLLFSVFCKLVFFPAVTLLILHSFGFSNIYMGIALFTTGAPCAVSSYPTAAEMGGDGELAGQLVAVTSILSTVTMVLWFVLLNHFQII